MPLARGPNDGIRLPLAAIPSFDIRREHLIGHEFEADLIGMVGHWTVTELSFEKKQLIVGLQRLVISHQT